MKKIKWLLINGLIASIAIYGIAFGNIIAANLFRFIQMYLFLTLIFFLLFGKASKEKPSVTSKTRITWNLLLAMFCAAYGWFGWATIVFLSGIVAALIMDRNEKGITDGSSAV